MSLRYEWCLEKINVLDDDIEDLYHFNTFAEARVFIRNTIARAMQGELTFKYKYDLCLIRDQFDNDDPYELIDRQWAYFVDGVLEPSFDRGAKVPAKFRNEVAA
jgi:hypothetical protein